MGGEQTLTVEISSVPLEVVSIRLALLLLGATALPSCVSTGVFNCNSDAQCVNGAESGRCEPNGFCSFPDDTCESGQRYGNLASADFAGQCTAIDPLDGSTDGPPADDAQLDGSDASSRDASCCAPRH